MALFNLYPQFSITSCLESSTQSLNTLFAHTGPITDNKKDPFFVHRNGQWNAIKVGLSI
jgi:hypothetical protein